MTDYAPDTFTEEDVKRCLDNAGLRYIDKGRYLLAHCPSHDDTHPSVQIYKDDFFVNCHAGCGRFHITKPFPALRPQGPSNASGSTDTRSVNRSKKSAKEKQVTEHKYVEQDQMEYWKSLPLIPRDHNFKFLPLEILDDLGWRWLEGMDSYYIPYFNRPKTKIPFSQMRHLNGERRFTFLKDAKPTLYGTWNLMPNMGKIFLVEGTSDAAVLETCGIPWIAAPSAASSALVGKMVVWAHEQGIQVVYAGDRDVAGDKLREVIDELGIPYRVKQCRDPYKDYGEMYEAEGLDSVTDYTMREIDPTWTIRTPKRFPSNMTQEEKILAIFPGATVQNLK